MLLNIGKTYHYSDKRLTSILTIEQSRMNDEGTYVCRSTDLQISSVQVHVLWGRFNFNVMCTFFINKPIKEVLDLKSFRSFGYNLKILNYSLHLSFVSIVSMSEHTGGEYRDEVRVLAEQDCG